MFEESPPSRYLTSLAHPEDSQGTTAAVSHVLRDQENTGHVPMDNSHSDLPANPTSLQQHLAKLKMLMSTQKAEYESKIASLEQRNRELQSEIKGMHSKLGQQRKWYSLVEMKMRNAERAKEDAEKRNEMLQKEMEEFFETFGEINRWK
ncbi:rho GTPase-activating protein 24-like [Pezoporus wallicus]|uniref:rho GTPase-activating protein 24-like n=1 Tax=Pezoporus wallicus TaxID=35540 RepID=UPI002551C624|nr:rho GTPase-activating protein 24-like [Pezoporus wallicus]XP_061312966.1 rho GTPase-activating protein 24-like [Pezoporus flaviventris]